MLTTILEIASKQIVEFAWLNDERGLASEKFEEVVRERAVKCMVFSDQDATDLDLFDIDTHQTGLVNLIFGSCKEAIDKKQFIEALSSDSCNWIFNENKIRARMRLFFMEESTLESYESPVKANNLAAHKDLRESFSSLLSRYKIDSFQTLKNDLPLSRLEIASWVGRLGEFQGLESELIEFEALREKFQDPDFVDQGHWDEGMTFSGIVSNLPGNFSDSVSKQSLINLGLLCCRGSFQEKSE